MKKHITKTLAIVFSLYLIIVLNACQTSPASTSMHRPAGGPEDVHYARQLWQALQEKQLVGEQARTSKPFFGGAKPHGMILEVMAQNLMLNKHTGFVIVKKNYNGDQVSVANVERDRKRYLSSITVMYQREAGYDPDNQNWFWVKYQPDGQLFEKNTPMGRFLMAGKIMKGKTPEQNGGCIYCHRSAGGGDYIFYPNIHNPNIGNKNQTH